MSCVDVSAALFPMPTTRTFKSLKSEGLPRFSQFQWNTNSPRWSVEPLEALNMDNLSLEVFHSLEDGNIRFGGESTTYHDFVKVSSFFTPCTFQTNLPLGSFRVPLDPLDRGVELHISVQIKVSGVGLKVVTYLRSSEVWRKV